MKVKSILTAICSVFCVGAFFGAVKMAGVEAKADTTVDISENITLSDWTDHNELSYLVLYLGDNVIEDFNYDAMDKDTYKYVQEYITFNGKTVKEINEDTSLGALEWEYTEFPSTADDIYKVPVIIRESGLSKLEMRVHDNYVAMLGDTVTVGVKSGLQFVTGGTTYAVQKDRSFQLKGIDLPEVVTPTDITENITIEGWDIVGDARELTYTRIKFGGVLPTSIGYGMIDSSAWKFFQEYLTINGKTVKEINENTDTSNYVFSTFPSSKLGATYEVPVMLFENDGTLEVKIHNDYLATLGGNIVIGVKAGLSFDNNGTTYTVTKDVEKVVTGTVVTDITDSITVTEWLNPNEFFYAYLNFPAEAFPLDIGYHIFDSDNGTQYHYIKDYITINGKTVAEINAETDVSGYVFESFPASAGAPYNVPVLLRGKSSASTMEIMIHKSYFETLDGVSIGVKEGMYFNNNGTKYVVSSDVSYVKDGSAWVTEAETTTVDITESVKIEGWQMMGDYSEVTRTVITFGEGVLPDDIGFHAIDKDAGTQYHYLQEYITINGKTIKEINETTDVSGYVFHTFPWTTTNVLFKVPVILYEDADALEVRMHNDYIASLGGNIDVVIGVKAGLTFTKGATIYTVSETVEEYVRRKNYTLTVELNPGMDEQYLPMGAEIVLTAPEREGYTFNGWFEKGTDNAALTVMPERDYAVYAKYTAIEYTVTFMDGETVIGTVPYTVEDKTITEPALPTKEGYTSAWETYALTGGDIVVNVVYTEIVVGTEYTVTFMDGSTVIATVTYIEGQTEIKEPAVPTKEGYTSAWETYTLSGDITVDVVYTAIEYTVTFKDGATVIGTATYTVENKTITEPAVPTKEGYTSAWATYTLSGDITVDVVYTAIEYTVTFKDGATVIGTATYTVENKEITEPALPTKEGYTSAWESYSLTIGNVVVSVIYTPAKVEEDSSNDSSSEDSSSNATSSEEKDSQASSSMNSETSSKESASSQDKNASNDTAPIEEGCFGAIGGISVGVIAFMAAVLLKKKENE